MLLHPRTEDVLGAPSLAKLGLQNTGSVGPQNTGSVGLQVRLQNTGATRKKDVRTVDRKGGKGGKNGKGKKGEKKGKGKKGNKGGSSSQMDADSLSVKQLLELVDDKVREEIDAIAAQVQAEGNSFE